MLDPTQIETASRTLHDHWRRGAKFAGLEAALRPSDRAEGYAIQATIEKHSSGACSAEKMRPPARPARSTSTLRGRWRAAFCQTP